MLPLSALCIHPKRAAWVLYVDAMCINYDGNVLDAALLGMVAALRNSKCCGTLFPLGVKLTMMRSSTAPETDV